MNKSPTTVQLNSFADCIISEPDMHKAIEFTAQRINSFYSGQELVFWPIMNSAIVFAGQLLPRLNMPLTMSCARVTRYTKNSASKNLQWILKPSENIEGKHVLVCDDIFDEGITLQGVCEYAATLNPASVKSVVMVNKVHSRKPALFSPNWVAAEVPDRYVFGMGMDSNDYWRNAPGIWAEK